MKCYKNFLYDILSFLQRADQIGLSHRGTVLNRTNVKVLLKRQYEAIINSSTQVRYIFICTDEVDKDFILLLTIAGSGDSHKKKIKGAVKALLSANVVTFVPQKIQFPAGS